MADILLTGGTGQVGLALQRLTWPDGTALHAPPRAELDLADPASVERALAARPYAAVISSGAYTAVDKAESEVAEAWRVNALAPAILAAGAARAGIPIVHLSTDYVFAGDAPGPYIETDPVAPVGVYGASKEGGEQAVRTANPRHAVLRTAWVVGPDGKNFIRTMLRLAADREEVGVVSDQHGCPTFTPDLAAVVQAVTLALMNDPTAEIGTFHVVNDGEASWSDFATAIFEGSAARGGPSARVKPITTAEYRTPALRPANSRLATGKIGRAYGVRMRPWREALDETLDVLVGPRG